MVFPVGVYGCESWTIKKAECQRINAFELWCWRLLRVPWSARRSNQSILREISPEYSLEGLMLKLKLQSFGHLMQRTDSLEKTLMLGKIEGGRRRGATENEMVGCHHRLNGHEFEQTLGVGDGQGSLVCCSPWDHKESDTTERLNWTELPTLPLVSESPSLPSSRPPSPDLTCLPEVPLSLVDSPLIGPSWEKQKTGLSTSTPPSFRRAKVFFETAVWTKYVSFDETVSAPLACPHCGGKVGVLRG